VITFFIWYLKLLHYAAMWPPGTGEFDSNHSSRNSMLTYAAYWMNFAAVHLHLLKKRAKHTPLGNIFDTIG